MISVFEKEERRYKLYSKVNIQKALSSQPLNNSRDYFFKLPKQVAIDALDVFLFLVSVFDEETRIVEEIGKKDPIRRTGREFFVNYRAPINPPP